MPRCIKKIGFGSGAGFGIGCFLPWKSIWTSQKYIDVFFSQKKKTIFVTSREFESSQIGKYYLNALALGLWRVLRIGQKKKKKMRKEGVGKSHVCKDISSNSAAKGS